MALAIRRSSSLALATAAILAVLPARARADSEAPSATVAVFAEPGTPASFRDANGHLHWFPHSYAEWFVKPRGKPRHALAVALNLGISTLGIGYYWLRTDINRQDWDRPSLMAKLSLEAFRFDNNDSLTNHVSHPFTGAAYYASARSNNLGIPTAIAYATASSALWEFGFEFRELASINDMAFTSVAGVAIGETIFQLGEYFTSGPGRWPYNLGAWTAGLPRKINSAFYTARTPNDLPYDELGYSTAFWHRFYFAPQMVAVDRNGSSDRLYGLIAEGEIIAMPGFGRPGSYGVSFEHGNFSEAETEFDTDSDGHFDLNLWFHSNLWGRYLQRYAPARSGGVNGHAGMIALSTALRYSDHDFLEGQDQFAVTHLLGPSASVWLARGATSARLDLNAHGDFAAIRSLAFDHHRESHDVTGVKTVLQDKGYQFHYGGSLRMRGRVEMGPWALGASGSYGTYRSIEGYDRFEERVTADLHGSERIWEYRMWLGFKVPGRALATRLAVEGFGRESQIADDEVLRWDLRGSMSVGARF